MTPLRTKDLVFIAVVLPVLSAAAYFHFWRKDAAARLDRLETECRGLVDPEEYPELKAAAERRLDEARAALEKEKNVKADESVVMRSAGRPEAMRENDVLRVFGEAGANVLKSERVPGSSAGALLSAASGIESPVCRKYTLEGPYPAIKRALDLFSSKRMAVVPERVEMQPSRPASWLVWIWQ